MPKPVVVCSPGVVVPAADDMGPWVFMVGSSKIQIHCSYRAAEQIAIGDAIDQKIDTVTFHGRLRL